MSRHFTIGDIKINDAYLNQVAASRKDLEAGNSGGARATGQVASAASAITEEERQEAFAFIRDYFLPEARRD